MIGKSIDRGYLEEMKRDSIRVLRALGEDYGKAETLRTNVQDETKLGAFLGYLAEGDQIIAYKRTMLSLMPKPLRTVGLRSAMDYLVALAVTGDYGKALVLQQKMAAHRAKETKGLEHYLWEMSAKYSPQVKEARDSANVLWYGKVKPATVAAKLEAKRYTSKVLGALARK